MDYSTLLCINLPRGAGKASKRAGRLAHGVEVTVKRFRPWVTCVVFIAAKQRLKAHSRLINSSFLAVQLAKINGLEKVAL